MQPVTIKKGGGTAHRGHLAMLHRHLQEPLRWSSGEPGGGSVRWLWVAVVALGFVSAFTEPALALSCPSPETTIATMDVVATGQVVSVPLRRVVHLKVQRYYKGYGPALLSARLRGVANLDDWIHQPSVGDELLIGFTQERETLVNGPCHLYLRLRGDSLPASLSELLGPGQEPVPGTTLTPPRWWPDWLPVLAAAVGVVVVVAVAARLWERWNNR